MKTFAKIVAVCVLLLVGWIFLAARIRQSRDEDSRRSIAMNLARLKEPAHHHWKKITGDLNVTWSYDDQAITRKQSERDIWTLQQSNNFHSLKHVRVNCAERASLVDYDVSTLESADLSRENATSDVWQYARYGDATSELLVDKICP